MRRTITGALLGAIVLMLVPRAAIATPPRAPRLTFELPGSGTPHSPGQPAVFPLTLRATQSVPAGKLIVNLPPGDLAGTSYPFSELNAGDARTLSISLPVHRVGAYAVLGVTSGAQLNAVVLVRPDRVQAMMSSDYESDRQRVLQDKLNNPRYRKRDGALDGIQIAIAAEKTHYGRGEPISFKVSILNTGITPHTLVDGDLGFRDLTVFIDGPTIDRQGHGKSLALTDPFPDGILRLAPGAEWDGRVTFDKASDLDEIASWPGHTFTYRFMFQSLAVPFFMVGRGLENLWQGSLTAGDSPAQTIVVDSVSAVGTAAGTAASNAVVIPWAPKGSRVSADGAPLDVDASYDATRPTAIYVPRDAGDDAGASPQPDPSRRGPSCAVSGSIDDASAAPWLALLALALVRRRDTRG